MSKAESKSTNKKSIMSSYSEDVAQKSKHPKSQGTFPEGKDDLPSFDAQMIELFAKRRRAAA